MNLAWRGADFVGVHLVYDAARPSDCHRGGSSPKRHQVDSILASWPCRHSANNHILAYTFAGIADGSSAENGLRQLSQQSDLRIQDGTEVSLQIGRRRSVRLVVDEIPLVFWVR